MFVLVPLLVQWQHRDAGGLLLSPSHWPLNGNPGHQPRGGNNYIRIEVTEY